MVNQVILVGKIAKDIEAKQITEKMFKTTVILQTTEAYKKGDQTQYKDSFHRLNFFGEGWKWLQARLKKGTKVYAEGKLDYSSYEKNGQKVYVTDIIGNKVVIVGDRDESK